MAFPIYVDCRTGRGGDVGGGEGLVRHRLEHALDLEKHGEGVRKTLVDAIWSVCKFFLVLLRYGHDVSTPCACQALYTGLPNTA